MLPGKPAQEPRMQWARIKPWISVAAAVAILGVVGWYVYGHPEILDSLWRLDSASLAAVAAGILVSLALGGYQLNVFLRHYGVAMPWYRWFGLYIMMSIANIVTPVRGGTGLAAVYLKSAYGLTLGRFAMVLVGTQVLLSLVNSALALAGVGLSWWFHGIFSAAALVAALLVMAACVVVFAVPALAESDRWGWRWVVRAVNGWHALVRERRLMGRLLALTLLQSLTQTACYALIYRGLGLDVSLAAVLTIVPMSIIASLISVTPAALGPYDAVLVALPVAYGLTVAQALAAVLVFRAIMLITSAVLAGVFAFAVRVPPGDKPPPA